MRAGPVVIYFGGNAEPLHPRGGEFQALLRAGIHVALITHRGYGRSDGAPSGAALLADGVRIFDAIGARPEVDPDAIGLWGRSLGTGVATFVAAERPARAVVLASPYTRLSDAAAHHYPWLPVR